MSGMTRFSESTSRVTALSTCSGAAGRVPIRLQRNPLGDDFQLACVTGAPNALIARSLLHA